MPRPLPLSPQPASATAHEARREERAAAVEDGMDRGHRVTPGPLAAFARFVLCGGGVGLASSPAVTVLALLMPWALANALVTVASTVLCTELHARFTFRTGRSAGLRQHWQSGGSAAISFVVTSVAMFALHAVQPSVGVLREQVVYLSASGLAGIGRFLVLRLFVFAIGRKRMSAPLRLEETLTTPSGPLRQEYPAPAPHRATRQRLPHRPSRCHQLNRTARQASPPLPHHHDNKESRRLAPLPPPRAHPAVPERGTPCAVREGVRARRRAGRRDGGGGPGTGAVPDGGDVEPVPAGLCQSQGPARRGRHR